jgi:hypothetical protein
MATCSVCCQETQLHVMGKPICIKCDAASPEERKARSEQFKLLPERAATAVGAQPHRVAAA